MNLGDVLKKALPWIGAAATGNVPALVAMAAKEVGDAIGVKVQPTVQAISAAVQGATPEQMAALQMREMDFKERMQAAGYKHAEDMGRIDLEASRATTERAGQLEGTAADLKAMPVLGPIMLFLRGCQRPAWGFGTLYIDFRVFEGTWKLQEGPIESAFWIVNFLVLGFLFGERAVQNMAPFISQMLAARK